MTAYSKSIWSQLKNKTIQDIAKALEKDGWIREATTGATQGTGTPTAEGSSYTFTQRRPNRHGF